MKTPPPEPDKLFKVVKYKRKTKNRNYSEGASLDAIYERDKGICWLCGKSVSRKEASRDHVKDFSDGGSSNKRNLKLAHRKCNVERATKKTGL